MIRLQYDITRLRVIQGSRSGCTRGGKYMAYADSPDAADRVVVVSGFPHRERPGLRSTFRCPKIHCFSCAVRSEDQTHVIRSIHICVIQGDRSAQNGIGTVIPVLIGCQSQRGINSSRFFQIEILHSVIRHHDLRNALFFSDIVLHYRSTLDRVIRRELDQVRKNLYGAVHPVKAVDSHVSFSYDDIQLQGLSAVITGVVTPDRVHAS